MEGGAGVVFGWEGKEVNEGEREKVEDAEVGKRRKESKGGRESKEEE